MIAQNTVQGVITAEAPQLPGAECGQWYVLHTKSRQEKAIAADLAAMRIGHFLPLVRHSRYYGNRKALVDEPLFPGYIFLRGPMEDAYKVDRTKRIAQILRVTNQLRLDWELRNLHVALWSGAPLHPYPYLRKGTRVEVRSGPFRGIQGIVDNPSDARRIALQVDMLGQAVSLEIDGALLDVIAEAA